MEDIRIELDGKKFVGKLKIEGEDRVKFSIYYNGRVKTDDKYYSRDQIESLKEVATLMLYKMVGDDF